MIRFLPILLIAAFSCAHPQKVSKPEKGDVGLSRIIKKDILESENEKRFGEAIGGRIFLEHKPLPTSEEFAAYANKIAKDVGKHSHRHWVDYHVVILDSKLPLAYGLPGGKVLISKFLLQGIQSESEFARPYRNTNCTHRSTRIL